MRIVFFIDQLVNADHDLDPLLISVVNTFYMTEFLVHSFFVPFEKIQGIIINLHKEIFKRFVHSVEIFSGVHHLLIHLIGNMHAEKFLVTGAPVLENVLYKFHEQAIAFNV